LRILRPRGRGAERRKCRCRKDGPACAADEDERLHARHEPGPPLLTRRLLLEADDVGDLRVHLPNRPDPQRPWVGEFAVEQEYGLGAKHYGSTLEIDHIVSLELGGSNDIANLYPEEAKLPGNAPGFHVKDKL
jgi:hypothetical protein